MLPDSVRLWLNKKSAKQRLAVSFPTQTKSQPASGEMVHPLHFGYPSAVEVRSDRMSAGSGRTICVVNNKAKVNTLNKLAVS